MKILSIKSMFKPNKLETKYKALEKYCRLDLNLPNDVYNQLAIARKGNGLADYARSKGVTIDISNAQKPAEGNIAITVSQLKPEKKGGIIRSLTSFISNDTKQITNRKVPDYIVVDHPWDDTQIVRHTSHEWEDNFLRTVYHSIANMVNSLTGKK